MVLSPFKRLMLGLFFAALLTLSLSAGLLAQTPDPASDAGRQMAGLSSQEQAVRADLEKLNRELEIAVERHNSTRVELNRLTLQLADSRAHLDILLQEQARQQDLLNSRLVATYKNDDVDLLSVILESSSMTELFARITYVSRISEEDSRLEQRFEQKAEEISAVTADIDQKRFEQMRVEKSLESEKQKVQGKIDERSRALGQIDSQIIQLLAEEAERRRVEAERAAAAQASILADLQISQEIQRQVVETALQYLGVPYVWGGESPQGFDCSGLTKYVYDKHGVELPHNAAMQFELGTPVEVADLQAGDLIFWGPGEPHHVAMYIGKGKYVEAPNFDEVVSISIFEVDDDYAGARRFPLKSRIQ